MVDYSTSELDKTIAETYGAIDTTTPIGDAYSAITPATTEAPGYAGIPTQSDISEFAGYVPPEPSTLGVIKAGEEYATPESTVRGQLASLLSGDSIYMQQARESAKEEANRLGLLSTSMAVGAGQGAAIRQALPIATQDAATRAGLLATQQQAEYQQEGRLTEASLSGSRAVQNAQLAQQQSDIQNKFQSDMAAAQSEDERNRIATDYSFQAAIKQADVVTQRAVQDADNAFQTAMAGADASVQATFSALQTRWDTESKASYATMIQEFELQKQSNEISEARYESALASSNQIMQNTQAVISEIVTNADLMQDPVTTKAMLNNVLDQSIASMNLISSMSGVDQVTYDALLNEYSAVMKF